MPLLNLYDTIILQQETTNKDEVWILGHKTTHASKSFLWHEDIPNIIDADAVILDLSTMSEFVSSCRHNSIDEHRQANRIKQSVTSNLESVVLGGGHVICLLYHSVAFKRFLGDMLPFNFQINEVRSRNKIFYRNHSFKKYLESIESVNYVLETPADDQETVSTMDSDLVLEKNSLIKDKGNKIIGAAYKVDSNSTQGRLTFLPSFMSNKHAEALYAIVTKLKGNILEPPPSWVRAVEIVGLSGIRNDIVDLESQKNVINKKLSDLEYQRIKREKSAELLYATGDQLEEAVKNVFVLLGFTEIKRGDEGQEDWKINLRSAPGVNIGVLEVKGKTKRTSQSDIVQCNKWVDNYLAKSTFGMVKGIFIPNQHRRDQFPETKEQRKHFEPNEIEYAESRKICIIPTYVLFESLNKIMGGQSPKRDKVEQLIFNTNGVLESIL